MRSLYFSVHTKRIYKYINLVSNQFGGVLYTAIERKTPPPHLFFLVFMLILSLEPPPQGLELEEKNKGGDIYSPRAKTGDCPTSLINSLISLSSEILFSLYILT